MIALGLAIMGIFLCAAMLGMILMVTWPKVFVPIWIVAIVFCLLKGFGVI